MHRKGWRLWAWWGFQFLQFVVMVLYLSFCAAVVVIAAVVYLASALKERLFDTRCEWRDIGERT